MAMAMPSLDSEERVAWRRWNGAGESRACAREASQALRGCGALRCEWRQQSKETKTGRSG